MPISAIYFLKKTFFPLSFEKKKSTTTTQNFLCVNKLSATYINVKIVNKHQFHGKIVNKYNFHGKIIVNKQLNCCTHIIDRLYEKTVSGR